MLRKVEAKRSGASEWSSITGGVKGISNPTQRRYASNEIAVFDWVAEFNFINGAVAKHDILSQFQPLYFYRFPRWRCGGFCFVPEGFLSFPGIGVIFMFSDITIMEGKSNKNHFALE